MNNEQMLLFCNWLEVHLPIVLKKFPYTKGSGCEVDISDNVIGPQGLDRFLHVLREMKVPCVSLKQYRNCLDDSIIDTLVEYLYTQPQSKLFFYQSFFCSSSIFYFVKFQFYLTAIINIKHDITYSHKQKQQRIQSDKCICRTIVSPTKDKFVC